MYIYRNVILNQPLREREKENIYHAKDSFVISGLNFEPTVSVKSFKAQLNLYDIIFGKTQKNHAC